MLQGGGHHRRDVGRGAARDRPAVRRAPSRDPPASRPGRQRRQPHTVAEGLGRRGLASPLPPRGAGFVLSPLQPPGRGRGARHIGLCAESRIDRAVIRGRQPGGARDRRGRVDRQLPRRAAGVCRGFPGHRRGRGGSDRRAQGRSAAGSAPLRRAAAFPRRAARRQLRPDGGPVHGRGVGRREPAAGRAGQRGLDSDLGHAGGPRLDGLGRGAEAAQRPRQPEPHPRRRADVRGARARSAAPADSGARDSGGSRSLAQARRKGLVRIASWRRNWRLPRN